MKNLFTAILLLGFFPVASIFTQSTYTTEKGETHLLGTFEKSAFDDEQYQKWYELVYEHYQPTEESISKINAVHDSDISVKIYLGTWCGDSKREVTKFLKLVDQSKIDMANVSFIGLDGRAEYRKQGPNREEKGLHIHRVPTFIFEKGGKEIARIVEHPVSSMETDVAQIYSGIAPTPNYRNANYLLKEMDEKSMADVDSSIHKYIRFYKSNARSESEINTLGYVLLAAKEYDKAMMAFKLNTLLFPENGNVFDSLAEGYKIIGKKEEAIENYMKSYSLDPKNENAIAMVKEMITGSTNM